MSPQTVITWGFLVSSVQDIFVVFGGNFPKSGGEPCSLNSVYIWQSSLDIVPLLLVFFTKIHIFWVSYEILGYGYCKDYVYLPEGAYPARLSPNDLLYDIDPIIECKNRCLDANGKSGGVDAHGRSAEYNIISNQAFFIQNSDKQCACSSGTCSERVGAASTTYTSYKISIGNRHWKLEIDPKKTKICKK